MSLSSYLVQRGKRGTWQLRVPIPRSLHAPGLPRERVKSMGTSDRRIACDRALPVLAQWKAEWARARGGEPTGVVAPPNIRPSERDLAAAATHWGFDLYLNRSERLRRDQAGVDDATWSAFVDKHTAGLERRARQLATGDFSAIEAGALQIAATEGWSITPDDPAFHEFKERLATATLDAMGVERRRLAGQLDAAPTSSLVVAERERASDKAKAGESLMELFDRYAEQRTAEAGKRDDTLAQDRKVIEQFTAFVGSDRSITSIKPEHVRDYRDTMRQLPPKWRERTDMRGLTMREAAAKARTRDMPRVALTTINKHLSTISPLFAWLIEERWDLTNPCTGLFYKRVKGKNPRPPLGTDRLTPCSLRRFSQALKRTGKSTDQARFEPSTGDTGYPYCVSLPV